MEPIKSLKQEMSLYKLANDGRGVLDSNDGEKSVTEKKKGKFFLSKLAQ
jgi:hypothetical protein